MRKAITDPVEVKRKEVEIEALKAQVRKQSEILQSMREEVTTAHNRMAESVTAATAIWVFVEERGDIITKAQLYEQHAKGDKKLSGSRIVEILEDYSGQIEVVLQEMKTVLDWMTSTQEERQILNLSFPDLGHLNVEEEVGVTNAGMQTPQSAPKADLPEVPEDSRSASVSARNGSSAHLVFT